MSDDELEKLAAAMKNISPSKAARKRGMEAAMAAFDSEFESETTAVTEAVEEKISATAQGLSAAPRPTGQTTYAGYVQTRGRDAMSKVKEFFTAPKAIMMMGTCAAALFATSLYIPNTRFEEMPKSAPQAVTAEVGADKAEDENDTIIVTARKQRAKQADVQAEPIAPSVEDSSSEFESAEIQLSPAPVTTSDKRAANQDTTVAQTATQAQGGINSIGDLLNQVRNDSAKTEVENREREAKFRQRRDQQAGLLTSYRAELRKLERAHGLEPSALPVLNGDADQAVREYRAVLEKINNLKAVAPNQNSSISPSGNNLRLFVSNQQSDIPEKINGYIVEQAPAEYKTVTETVAVQEASTELVTIPATYETVSETVVVQPQSVEYVAEPPKYEWVEGDIEGGSVEYVVVPAQYETIQEPVVVQEASTELVTIPATYETVTETVVVQPQHVTSDGTVVPPVTKQQTRRVVKTPASTQERVIPAITKIETRRVIKTPASTVEHIVPYLKKDGKTRVPVEPAKVKERVVPAVTKQVSRRVVKIPARTQERVKPTVSKQMTRQVLVSPQKFYLRDTDGKIVREFESRDQFEKYQASLTTSVKETPVSTFSVDVDTASYSFLRGFINRGQIPPRSSIRLEEMINYFPYDYEAPRSADEPFKANVTVTPNPWNADTKLMHIGIKGYVPEVDEKPRSNIVFLIDTSGSMRQPNKLPLLISSFKLLLSTLDDNDTVSIVTYAGSAGTVLEPTAASDKGKIKKALDNLRAGGSTAGAAGLELAYLKAQESFVDEGNNRVILATDGDFNVGFSSSDEMKTYIEKKRESGIFLSVLGFGNGNYNDHLMQSLAQNGNGVAAYIDTLAEANKVLANEAGSALITIAKDVKIQVEFNPATIAEYRLIGYETRALKRQDFNNDKVDAGEINAGHTVTAIYEMTPVGSPAQVIDELRYASDTVQGNGSDEYAFVKIRHKLPSSDSSTLQTFPAGDGQERSLRRASDDMRFATVVAAFGQKLRGDTQLEEFSYDEMIKLATDAKGKDEKGYRAEFIQLMRLAKNLED